MRSQWYFKFEVIALFFVGVLLFTFGLANQEIMGFESRFYLFALEMWRHGPHLFPTTYREPYPDYPVTSTLLIYGVAELFGHLNKWMAVLPSSMAASGTLCVTYMIGRQSSRVMGWAAVFFLFFTVAFVTEARTISLDQYVTLVTTLCFYVVYFNKPQWLIYLFLLVGFIFRGPLGLVIPAGVVAAMYLLDRSYRHLFIFALLSFCLLIVSTLLLMALAYHAAGYLFMQDVLRMQVVGRLHDPHSPPNYYYFRDCLTGYFVTYPLTLLLLWGYLKHDKFRKFLAWAVILLIGLSIPSDKKMRYILPFAPALALMCSYLFYDSQNRYTDFIRKCFNVFCFIFPLIAAGVIWYVKTTQPALEFPYAMLNILFCVLQAINILLRKNSLALLAIAAGCFFAGNIFLVEKITLQKNTTREFVLQTETLRQAYQTPLVFFQEGPDGLPIKYLVDMPRESKPVFLYDSQELLKLKPHTFIVVSEDNLSHIPHSVLQSLSVMTRSHIGHDAVVLLIKN